MYLGQWAADVSGGVGAVVGGDWSRSFPTPHSALTVAWSFLRGAALYERTRVRRAADVPVLMARPAFGAFPEHQRENKGPRAPGGSQGNAPV